MPDFTEPPWRDVAAFAREYRLGPGAHRRRRARSRSAWPASSSTASSRRCSTAKATEGTAQELSAVELKKRMDTLDGLGAHAIQFFIVVIAALMVLGQLGLDIGPAVAGPRRRRDRRRLRGAEPGPRLPQRRAHPHREPVRQGRRRPHRRGRRHGRGLHPAPDDPARPRRRRPHGPQRRDQGRLQPDPRLGADQPGRHRRLRHGHRQGHRGRRRGRPGDGRRPGLEAPRPRGARASSGSRRSASPA